MMRESGSVKLYWSVSRGPGVGGVDLVPSRLTLPTCKTPAVWARSRICTNRSWSSGVSGFAELGQRVVVRMQVAGEEAEGDALVGGPFQLAGTEDARGIAIEEQPE